jgi:nucleoside-diphosphate-sugar epimerase
MASPLVTGATGFIGRALCDALLREGHTPRPLSSGDGDISDPDTLSLLPPVTEVFHLAGLTFVPESWVDPLEFQRVNVLGTVNVLEYCRRSGARLTFMSGYLYGQPERLPVSEATVPKPNNPYALSKYLAEQMCAFYASYCGVDVTVIRPFNVFGPGQPARFLVPHILNQVRERRAIVVKDLAPRRDFVYIADLVDALIRTLDRPAGYDVFNIGSGASVSVGELIATIQSVAGTDLPVACEGEVRSQEIVDVYADIAKAQRVLGWTPAHSLAEGLERTLSAN